MAPKRARAVSTSRPLSWVAASCPTRAKTTSRSSSSALIPLSNEERFISPKAKQKYILRFMKEGIINESGIVLPIAKFPSFVQVSTTRGWEQFINPPSTPPNTTIVREFYANYDCKTNSEIVKVRGHEVDISVPTINAVYGLPPTVVSTILHGWDVHIRDYILDDYTNFIEKPDMTKVYKLICRDGHHMTECSTTGTINNRDLSMEARVWLHFINSRLMPSTHFTEITKDRQLLIYSIMNGLSINVGHLILQMLRSAAKAKRGKLPFPCLVSVLCEQAGVPRLDDDRIEGSKNPINDNLVADLVRRDSRLQDNSGPQSDVPLIAPHRLQRPRRANNVDHVQAQLDAIMREEAATRRLSTMYFQHLDGMIRILATSLGANVSFPEFPTIDENEAEHNSET